VTMQKSPSRMADFEALTAFAMLDSASGRARVPLGGI
jgi:hypothetical protein